MSFCLPQMPFCGLAGLQFFSSAKAMPEKNIRRYTARRISVAVSAWSASPASEVISLPLVNKFAPGRLGFEFFQEENLFGAVNFK